MDIMIILYFLIVIIRFDLAIERASIKKLDKNLFKDLKINFQIHDIKIVHNNF